MPSFIFIIAYSFSNAKIISLYFKKKLKKFKAIFRRITKKHEFLDGDLKNINFMKTPENDVK